MKMKALLIFFAVTTSAFAANEETTGVESITTFHKALEDVAADPKYADKFLDFVTQYKAFCEPESIEDSKIEAASKCDPSINFPIAHKCAEETYKARKIMTWNERRKVECAQEQTYEDIEREVDLCISKESNAQNFTIPQIISPEEVKTKTKDQIAEKVISVVKEMQTCLGKSLA